MNVVPVGRNFLQVYNHKLDNVPERCSALKYFWKASPRLSQGFIFFLLMGQSGKFLICFIWRPSHMISRCITSAPVADKSISTSV